ncbi:MAG: hypothetical protein H7Y11_11635, partial [Armatimonadetes bacterium]|nr:hypothetical protein [Anaerolineae bacterium]
EYRSRGLVRALFEAVHERSAALGHQLYAITGIAHFYRQFGYTMAVERGRHAVYSLAALPDLAADYQPTYTLRPASPDDIPAMTAWHAHFARERLLTDAFSPESWRYEITGRHWGFYPHTDYQIIVDAAGQDVGYITMLSSPAETYETRCIAYVVGENASYLATFDDVMQGIKAWALQHYGRCPAMLIFNTDIHTTLDTLIANSRGGHLEARKYAWYLRVPDAIGFLQTIRPVLEARLAGSGAQGYTGELRIGFHDLTGISLRFTAGQLSDIQALRGKDGYDVAFPWGLFWNIVFGYQTSDEVLALAVDTDITGKAAVLLEILFPKMRSAVHGLV